MCNSQYNNLNEYWIYFGTVEVHIRIRNRIVSYYAKICLCFSQYITENQITQRLDICAHNTKVYDSKNPGIQIGIIYMLFMKILVMWYWFHNLKIFCINGRPWRPPRLLRRKVWFYTNPVKTKGFPVLNVASISSQIEWSISPFKIWIPVSPKGGEFWKVFSKFQP